MILEHYDDHFLEWPILNYRQGEGKSMVAAMGFKPNGLWVSVPGGDPDWPEWCRGEDFAIEKLIHCTRVELKPDAEIKLITNAAEIEAFDREYGTELQLSPEFSHHVIDWHKVAQEYDGIIITPYLWSHRMKNGFMWYYGWDCASGCIWQGDAIAGLHHQTDRIAA